jgi:hypothetical protein
MASEIKFYGVNETLFYLKNYEKELFDQFKKKLQDKAEPLTQLVASRFSSQPPLSNWHTSGGRVGIARLPAYKPSKSSVKAISGGFQRKTAKGEYAILRIQQNDGGAQVYDSAGSRLSGKLGAGSTRGERFVANLDKKQASVRSVGGGTYRSRIMFGAVKNNQHMIEEAVLKVVKEVDGYTTKRINDPRSK